MGYLEIVIIGCPFPFKRDINNPSGPAYRIKGIKHLYQHSPLLPDVEGFAERMAKGPSQVNGPWRFYLLGELPDY